MIHRNPVFTMTEPLYPKRSSVKARTFRAVLTWTALHVGAMVILGCGGSERHGELPHPPGTPPPTQLDENDDDEESEQIQTGESQSFGSMALTELDHIIMAADEAWATAPPRAR